MIYTIQFTALLLVMLVAGVFWGPWFALHRSLHIFSSAEFLKIVKTLAANMGRPMSIMMPVCILFVAAAIFTYPEKDGAGFYLIILSLIFIVISLVITMVVEVPIVTEMKQHTPETLPTNWEAKRDRWVRFHFYRMIAGVGSFGLLVAALL